MSTFEIVRGVEGDCLVLDGTRICGPKPWGGGRIINIFRTDGIYEVIDKDECRKLMDENAKLRELAVSYDSALSRMCSQMQGHVLCRDCILGKDYDNEDSCAIDELRDCMRELRVEVDE